MAVSKNRGTPKWMVYLMENPIKNGMIWGVHPYFWKHPYDGMFLFLFLIDVFFQEDMKKHNPVQVSH